MILKQELPLVSVMIATYNSGSVLPRVLESIRSQSYPNDKIEILIIDGGSVDDTINIARKYNCIIEYNPKTNPVEAKLIGISRAKGKYLLSVDHDEVMENRDSILNRIVLLESNPNCKVAFCSGYKRPEYYPAINQYISEFGDPFSLFIYNFSKDYSFFLKLLKRYFGLIEEKKDYCIISFENARHPIIIELVCLATIIDLEYFRKNFDLSDSETMAHLFYLMLEKGVYNVIVTKNDPILHYSADSMRAYLPKIKWRICNNVHFSERGKQGYSGRQKYTGGGSYKKYLFVLYTICIPVLIGHAGYLALTRKNAVYLLHPFLCWYTLIEIIWQITLKSIGIKPYLKSYDGKKKIEE